MDGKWGRIPGRQGPRAVKPERPALLFSLQCSGTPGQRSCPPQTLIVNNSLTKPAQFEPSTANARPAWRLVSRVSGRKGRDDITGVPHESPFCSELDRRHLRVLQPGAGPLPRDRPQPRTGDLAQERAATERP